MAKENAKRISGVYPETSAAGKMAFAKMLYPAKSDGFFHPDYEQIKADIDEYFSRNTIHNPGGLRLALRNVEPETLALWMAGYIKMDDVADEDCGPNVDLSSVTRYAANRMIDAFSTLDSKNHTQLAIRYLESLGALNPSKKIIDINLNGLGTWEKASK